MPVLVFQGGPAVAVDSVPNPPIDPSCGLDLTLVLDASGSVQSADAVEDVRDSGQALLEALGNTNSTARVLQFATYSQQLAPRILIDDASLASDGALGEALVGYYNPKPPQPAGSDIYSYHGDDPQNPGSFSKSTGSNQYTNWDTSLDQAGTEIAELVVYVTDGDPTSYNFDETGDPFDDDDVAIGTDHDAAATTTIDRAVDEANQIKNAGTRILAVGVGHALGNASSQQRLEQIAGPQLVNSDDLDTVDNINQVDVALVEDFADLADFMQGIAFSLCSPSLTIRKLAQHADDTAYTPEAAWPITATPTVAGGTFTWVLPDTAPAASKTVNTDTNGFAQFQWSPDPSGADSAVTVVEGTRPNYTAGRPSGDDYQCQLRNASGTVRTVKGEFADPANPSFEIDPMGREIATCTLYNSYVYDPQIAIEKTDSPDQLRGDLTPKATVTAQYVVTNPGNTPIADPVVTDDRCSPVTYGSGDADDDGLLDPGEQWLYTCTAPVRTAQSADPAGQSVTNTVDVTGTGPNGTVVTATDSDTVTVYTPAITVAKTANGTDTATIIAGADVTYSYVVTNTGNTPLAGVALADDTPPCTSPTLTDQGDGDDVLDVGESWTYQCVSPAVQEGVVNTASVSATPQRPGTGGPFEGANPPVTAIDNAAVAVENPAIDLTKTAAPQTVILGPDGSAETVTYTFTATNTGTDPLAGPTGTPGTGQTWITDSRCQDPPSYTGGDTNSNGLLDPGEAWTFTCTAQITARTVNIAQITATPTDPGGNPIGSPISSWAVAVVQAVKPGIEVTKTAIRSTVLDPDAPAVSGPDTPDPRPAQYRYEVINTGQVELQLDPAPTDDKCAPLTFQGGDTDADGLLDPGELWTYTCQITLQRQDAGTPPGNQSAAVDNTVTVTGVPSLGGTPHPDKVVTATATAVVNVIEPGLTLTKTASADSVKNGRQVTYTFAVANTGDVALILTTPSDDKCSPLTFADGDTNNDGRLDGANTSAETWTWICTRAVFAPDSGGPADTNTATVTATGPLGNTYHATDSAAVTVVLPAIRVVKTPNHTLVPAGTPVTYRFDVTNIGQSDLPAADVLEAVTLRDVSKPGLPECRQPQLVAKTGGNQDDILERDPAEVWTYECTATLTDPATNVALVGAIGSPGDLRFAVGDYDVTRVGVFHPGLAITKTAEPTQLSAPGQVTYTYQVTNTGDVPLANITQTITDDTCTPVTYVSGDTNTNDLLDTANSIFEDALAETWTYQCVTTVHDTTTNTATVTGTPTDPDGNPLCGPGAIQRQITTPCDVTAQGQANVRLAAPLPDTSGANRVRPALHLAALFIVAGAILVLAARRTRIARLVA